MQVKRECDFARMLRITELPRLRVFEHSSLETTLSKAVQSIPIVHPSAVNGH